MRTPIVALALAAGLIGCGSQPASNEPAATPSPTASTGDMSDAAAIKEIGVNACLERVTSAHKERATPAQRQSCACAVDRLAAGKSTEDIQALWARKDYAQVEEQARASCGGG